MIFKSFSRVSRLSCALLSFIFGATQPSLGQGLFSSVSTSLTDAFTRAMEPTDDHWYVGAGLGTSFGQCTFRSITESDSHWGFQGSILGGYRMTRFLSFEASLQMGAQTETVLDCCPFWLSAKGERYVTPIANTDGWFYSDIESRTGWGRLTIQANFDQLSIFTAPGCKWSLNLSPQLSVVTTKSTLVTPTDDIDCDRQWHLGLGGQASAGYQINDRIGAALYSSIVCLTGKRFDNIPEHFHKSNFIWDTGIKVTYRLGTSSKKVRIAQQNAEIQKAAQQALQRQREEAEKDSLLAAARAEKERIFKTPIPTVYFQNNSWSIDSTYVESLEDALSILNRYEDFNLEIHAYCSKSGDKKYNDNLSQLRMEAVREWFTERGISMTRVEKSYFHGIDYDADTDEHARRVELKFVK